MKKATATQRTLSLALGAALTAGLLAGCSSAASTAPAADSAAASAATADSAAESSAPAAIDGEGLLDPAAPTVVTIWNYYNGDQLTAFENLVSEFNASVGAEKGIVVSSVSQGSIDGLADALIDAVNGKVGADDVPSAASVYSETAYILDKADSIVPLDGYFSSDELAAYIPAFLEEGRLRKDGELMTMPVSKSTEVLITNATDWADFEAATGVSIDSITDYEALTAAAEQYYAWTDEQTPDVPEDGKALYGRDSTANYLFVGAAQLGHPLFTVADDGAVTTDLDRATFKTMWDNYYIPTINGYFGSYGKFRSEDLKTGAILCLTGSSSGMSYYSTTVTDSDDVSHDIEISVAKSLSFKDSTNPVSVQQGAGYCVMKTSDAEQYATMEFLKWFTDTAQNLNFSVQSGYSPVKIEANDPAKIETAVTDDSPKAKNKLASMLVSAEVYTSGNTYTTPAFEGSKEARTALETALQDACTKDREAVEAAIAGGATRADAVAPYSTEEYFDAWYENVCNQVKAIVGEK